MSFNKKLCVSALALCLLMLAGLVSRGQDYQIGASATPNPVLLSNTITYTVFVTNRTGFNRTSVYVTNSFSAAASVGVVTNSLPGTVEIAGASVVFRINSFINSTVAQLTLNLTPFAPGSFTNEITVADIGIPPATTNLVTEVIFPNADLGVSLTNVASGIFTNDATVIGLFVTNAGPDAATGVVVDHQLPASFALVSLSPATASTTYSGSNLTWNVGALASGVATQLLVTVRPATAGTFNLSAAVSGNLNDTNPANNAVTNSINVISFLPSDLLVSVLSQQINRQTGLLDMWVQVTNRAGTNVPAIRVVATNLPASTWLYNAVGTNSSGPYVSYNSTVFSNSSINLLLEFYRIPRAILTNYVPEVLALPLTTVTPPATNGVAVTKMLMTTNGFLIEFPATIGKTYTIIYTDNLGLTNWQTAQPSIVAPANRVQWLDNGPPKTISNSPTRLYRVQESP